MRATSRAAPALVFALAMLVGSAAFARGPAARRSSSRTLRAVPARAHLPSGRAKVAVQPFEGPNTESLRNLIVRIVRGRGFRTMTTLPLYDGTGQYPSVAREHNLAAFVTAGVEGRGRWQRITFLIWSGLTGSVLGRWTASAPTAGLGRAVGQGFWQHLGPAMRRAKAPPLGPSMDEAPPMRIDASDSMTSARVATR